jgi:putative hydrolase of the HAD superfamily
MPSARDLDAVTIDAMGTLVELESPVERLRAALAERGVERTSDEIAAAFNTEVEYYLAHKLEARDTDSLSELRHECARVFLEGAGAEIDPAEFSPAFGDAMVFQPLDGSVEALVRLRAAGLALACVSDWDIGLGEQLAKIRLSRHFDLVLTSAETGAPKPDPAIFSKAVERIGVEPGRALHVGDDDADRAGAGAAGLAFEPVPLATIPERLGLR